MFKERTHGIMTHLSVKCLQPLLRTLIGRSWSRIIIIIKRLQYGSCYYFVILYKSYTLRIVVIRFRPDVCVLLRIYFIPLITKRRPPGQYFSNNYTNAILYYPYLSLFIFFYVFLKLHFFCWIFVCFPNAMVLETYSYLYSICVTDRDSAVNNSRKTIE